MSRKPWQTPVIYNEDRFDDKADTPAASEFDEDGDERDASDVEELLCRPDEKGGRTYECNDSTPLNYGKGPHEEEFGVDESEFDAPDDNPVDYRNGPHEDEFGDDDEDDVQTP